MLKFKTITPNKSAGSVIRSANWIFFYSDVWIDSQTYFDKKIMKLLISFRSFIRHYCGRRLKSKVSEKLAGLTPKHEVRTGPAENMETEGHRLYTV